MDDPVDMVRGAEKAARRMRGQARWYPSWVAVLGVLSVVQVALVPVFKISWTIPFAVVAVIAVTALTVWRYRQPVRPVSDRRVNTWIACWLVLYLLVGWLVGPRLAGTSVVLWAVLGLLQAAPAFIEAAIWVGRTRS